MSKVKTSQLLPPWIIGSTNTGNFKRANTKNYNLYNSTAWRRTSKQNRNSNPVCEVSLSTDRPFPSEVTDHIVPINQGGAVFDKRNLMAMSHHFHNIKSGKEKHKPILVKTRKNDNGELIPKDRNEIIELLIKADK